MHAHSFLPQRAWQSLSYTSPLPLTPHPTRGDRVRHLSPLRGPHTAESSNARRKALCSRAVSRLENQCFDPKRGVLCERNPGRSSLIWVDTRWIISSRFLEWINQRAIVIVSCVCCIWKRGWKYSKRRGVDARNCKKTIDLWTVFLLFFRRFLLIRIYIFINDLSLGEKCSINNIPVSFPRKEEEEICRWSANIPENNAFRFSPD